MDYSTEEGRINRWSIIDHLAQSGVNYLLFYTQQTTIILIKYGRHHIRCKDHTSRATDVHGAKSFVFCVVFCRQLFVLLSFFFFLYINPCSGHYIVCPSTYDYLLPLWYLLQTFQSSFSNFLTYMYIWNTKLVSFLDLAG